MPDVPRPDVPPLPPVPDVVTLVLAALEAAALRRLLQTTQTDGVALPPLRPRHVTPSWPCGKAPLPPV